MNEKIIQRIQIVQCKTCPHLIVKARTDLFPEGLLQYYCGACDIDAEYIREFKKTENGLEPHYIGWNLPRENNGRWKFCPLPEISEHAQ